ncbi:MAG TPA: sterol desaturase family protein [Nitrospiraceae bacterium]|nr:sterol desaturase family protein [Nitrospiraceae bacterium]
MIKTDVLIRLAGFLGAFGLLAIWEICAPRRALTNSKARRWVANLGIVVIDALLIRILFATGAVGAALMAAQHAWGLLNQWRGPAWLEIIMAVIALDLALYLQHVLFHAVPILWRLHMMHHADLDVDVTTGVRFHPAEIALSMLIKIGIILLIGASPTAVVIFEVLLNATSLFNHSNVRIPTSLETVIRSLVVTPDMHRIHHSVHARETNSNFGFNLSWWDRLVGTYRAEPQDGQTAMSLGLEQFRDPDRLTLLGILVMPLVGSPGRYPLSGREK